MCEHLLFSAILRQHNDMESVVIDVGGNAGVFTNLFASFPNVGQVYTFEASPKTFKRLQASVCVNDNVRKVHLFNCGVSEKDEIINLSHLWHSGQTSRVATGGDVRVPSHPMDAVLLDKVKNHGHALAKAPVLMKLDCEGCELGALQGATRMLRKYPPKYIFFEYTSGDPKDFLNILHANDYRVYRLGPLDCKYRDVYKSIYDEEVRDETALLRLHEFIAVHKSNTRPLDLNIA